jgi:imidazolonepropionase-like amidohydrolase
MTLALTAGRIVDGRGGRVRDGALLVHDTNVVGISTGDLPSDVTVLDVGGRTIMPGIIDAHIHFALWAPELILHQDKSVMEMACETVQALGSVVPAGLTAARDPGGLDIGFREAIRRRLIAGPEIQTSIVIIGPTNGTDDFTTIQGLASPMMPGMPRSEADGPDACRAKVREVLRAGADFIKIATSGGASSARVRPDQPVYTPSEVAAIVDEAHAWGVPVVCHALKNPGLLMAVQAGVDSIEHGCWLDEETAREMARRGTWYVPTMAAYRLHARLGPEYKRTRAIAAVEAHSLSLTRALDAGVRIAMGSDAGGYGHDFAFELECLLDAGMSAAAVIEASTYRAAECLGIADRVGSLEEGKQADVIVVDGRPDEDPRVLRTEATIALVLKAGEVVASSMPLGDLASPV